MQNYKPLYLWSLEEAIRNNEKDLWRESYKENCDCARTIEKAITDAYNYEKSCLTACAKPVIEQYGFDRVNWVLANTVQQKKEDGRFSQENKAWARQIYIPHDEVRWHFCVESHPGLTDNSDLEEKQERLVSLRQRIDELTSMDSESAQSGDFDELFESLYTEMYSIKDELEDAEKTNAKLDTAVNRIDEMTTVMYGLKNHPVEYDEQIVRQLISSIKVVAAEQILILFKDGTEMTADL